MTTYRNNQARVSLLERCRRLRRDTTDAEALLWRLLRARQVAGAKFRRQHQFGTFILDFFCAESRLAVELDGGHHSMQEQAEKDDARTLFLTGQAVTVLRFKNIEVLTEPEAVVTRIWDAIAEPSP